MILTTVKCALCDVQRSAWCQGRCTHAKAAITPPKADKKAKVAPTPKRPAQGGKTPVPVYCLTTKTWYVSATEAANAHGISEAYINKCCKGEQHKAGGMRWMKYGDSNLPEEASVKVKYKKKPHKRVRHIPTGTEYDSARQAAKALKIGKQTIYNYLRPGFERTKTLEYITEDDDAV